MSNLPEKNTRRKIDACPICGSELRGVEEIKRYYHIPQLTLYVIHGDRDCLGLPPDDMPEETSWEQIGFYIYCENSHNEEEMLAELAKQQRNSD